MPESPSNPNKLPEPGTIFAMPLADGRTGVCRVLQIGVEGGAPRALVAASEWIGAEAPALNHPLVRKILILNHHALKNKPAIRWVSVPPPAEFKDLGRIPVTREDLRATSETSGGWSFPLDVLNQWRWHHDRDAVLAEDAAKREQQATKRAEAIRKRAEYLAAVSLDDLLAKNLFRTWIHHPTPAAKAGCVRIIRDLLEDLKAMAEPSHDLAGETVYEAVKALNALDAELDGFIDTVVREDLCEVLEEILHAVKCADLVGEIEHWREW